jgi:hypothetical protein
MRRFGLIVLLVIGISGIPACASIFKYKVIRISDFTTGTEIIKMEPNLIGWQSGQAETRNREITVKPADQVFVDMMVTLDKDKNKRYFAEIILRRYVDHSWGRVKLSDYFLIKEGVSLSLTVDGEPILLVVDKPSRPDLSVDNTNQEQTRELIEETAIYKLSREHITRVANAKNISMTLSGEHDKFSIEWSSWNIRNVRMFWDEVNQSTTQK